jgi:hypothetical protein
LESLSTGSISSAQPLHDVVTSAFKEAANAKERERIRKESILAEIEDNKRLNDERIKLKGRFTFGSVDEEGENPLLYLKTLPNTTSLGNEEINNFHLANFEDIVGNDFDLVLDDLERELELRAPEKGQG